MSGDGKQTSPFQYNARDVFGFSLDYYNGDYTAIGGTDAAAFGLYYTPPVFDMSGLLRSAESRKGLYNGNISQSTYFIKPVDDGNTRGYSYRYDQLNRLTTSNAHTITGSSGWSNSSIMTAYKESISYDANGNIKTFLRNGSNSGGNPLQMDELTYGYTENSDGHLVNNKLRQVKDAVAASNYTAAGTGSVADRDNQADDNYTYDKIGNLTGDNAESIQRINWTVYGKIASIVKSSTTIGYGYDAGGNRSNKGLSNGEKTYYDRDAQGNAMSVYRVATGGYHWQEQHLYGLSRVGIVMPGFTIHTGEPLSSDDYTITNDPVNNGIEGLRNYELSNHLGNVLVIITDKKIGILTQFDKFKPISFAIVMQIVTYTYIQHMVLK